MGPGDDDRAPGAAITVELCGRVDHEPPCPLAPHHTAAVREGDAVRLRILFATDPEREPEVRRRIAAALARWRLLSDGPDAIRSSEADHAGRLVAS
ncbi:MAG: hypothetical protein QOD86_148 [Miltoncostaeaceae bacterium]|nr:hypothetical protein [Miltoncostaeaceae bacterium]